MDETSKRPPCAATCTRCYGFAFADTFRTISFGTAGSPSRGVKGDQNMTAFMLPYVTLEAFLVVENTRGESFAFPADVVGALDADTEKRLDAGETVDIGECTCGDADDCCVPCSLRSALRDYIEGDAGSVERVTGKYWARLSAPGYLDATDWDGPHDTEEAAKHALSEQYDVCSECGEDMDEQEGDTCASCKGDETTEEGD